MRELSHGRNDGLQGFYESGEYSLLEQEDIKVCKVDIDDQIQLAQQFRVMSVPTLIVMKHGKVVNQSVGLIPKAKVLSLLK